MGHQINFFLGPKDLLDLETRLRSVGELVILHSRSPKPEPQIVESVDYTENGKRWLLHLVRPVELPEVLLKNVVAQGYWIVDSMFSPVVELDRCHYNGEVLKRGRLYYVDGFYERNERVQKPSEFIAWAKRLFTVARKTLKYEKELLAYVGPQALELRSRAVELNSI